MDPSRRPQTRPLSHVVLHAMAPPRPRLSVSGSGVFSSPAGDCLLAPSFPARAGPSYFCGPLRTRVSGSSPHVRGSRQAWSATSGVHPRARGGGPSVRRRTSASGSSPRARGRVGTASVSLPARPVHPRFSAPTFKPLKSWGCGSLLGAVPRPVPHWRSVGSGLGVMLGLVLPATSVTAATSLRRRDTNAGSTARTGEPASHRPPMPRPDGTHCRSA